MENPKFITLKNKGKIQGKIISKFFLYKNYEQMNTKLIEEKFYKISTLEEKLYKIDMAVIGLRNA